MTEPSFMPATMSRVTSFGASAPGMSTAPITTSASATDSSICRLDDIRSVTRAPSTSSRLRIRSIERSMIVTLAPEPERDHGGVVADHPAADDDDLAGRDARHAAEQEAAATERLLEEVGARLRREPAGDLAHRREQGRARLLVSTVS